MPETDPLVAALFDAPPGSSVTASELLGGIWDDAYPSSVVDAYASAAAVVEQAAVRGAVEPTIKTWTIKATDAVISYAPNGRGVIGYPAPPFVPPWIVSSLFNPGTALALGIDYQIDAASGLILFDVDPVTYFPIYATWIDSVPVSTATLWSGLSAPTITPVEPQPATTAALFSAVASACDSPVVTTRQTVEAVFQADDGWQVITDVGVYRLGSSDVPSVSAGDVLVPGTPVGSAWTLTRLGSTKPNVPYLTTPASFHQGATVGGITWYDETVPLVIDSFGGRTRVRFRLGAASQADLDTFWAQSHANGVGPGGITLAQALDTRANKVGDPDATSLPTTVNPLELVCRELLAGSAYLLVAHPSHLGPNAVTDDARSELIGGATGPYVAVFSYTDAVPALDRFDPS